MENAFAWMAPPDGGAPQKVSESEISNKMWLGWTQCDEPKQQQQPKGEK